jgi:hypothetical protein
MRRFRDRTPATLFRGNEMVRLATMCVMLGVLWLLVDRAGDENTWRWLTANGESPPVAATPTEVVAAELAASGPTDEDDQERDAAREELEAVTDKRPLATEEMPAYWRLMEWGEHQSISQLRARADQRVTFNQLWQRPDAFRGKLVEIPLHLRRTLRQGDLAENPLGLKTVYELWGWNSDSQPYWYWLVCPQLPEGMPEGSSIYEEATFVGYFFKLLPYEDHQGKHLATPLLIGRLIWHPEQPNPLARSDEWAWSWIVAAVLGVLFVARWGFTWWRHKPGADLRSAGVGAPDEEAVESWLQRAEHEPSVQDEQDIALTNGDPGPPGESAGPPDPR